MAPNEPRISSVMPCIPTCNNRKVSLMFLLRTIQQRQFKQKDVYSLPRQISVSVISCHLFIATIHLSSLRRQLSLCLDRIFSARQRNETYLISTTRRSFPTREEIVCNLSRENLCPGNKYEVTITLTSNTLTTLYACIISNSLY